MNHIYLTTSSNKYRIQLVTSNFIRKVVVLNRNFREIVYYEEKLFRGKQAPNGAMRFLFS